jgi:hypothetical protein
MADQGDGNSLLCRLGVANVRPWSYAEFTHHIFTSWRPHRWYGEACGVPGSGEPVHSSQSLLVFPAKALTPLLGWGDGLDTRAVGILGVLVFGALLTLFVVLLPGRALFRALIAALVTLVMADSVFADFFISPYSETAAFLGVFAIVIALMFLWRRDRVDLAGIIAVILATSFTIAANARMTSVLPVIAVALLWHPFRRRRDRAHRPDTASRAEISPARRAGMALLTRVPAVLAVVALTTFTGLTLAEHPHRSDEVTLYNAVFTGLLTHSPTPKSDLAWFGLDPSFAQSSGTTMTSGNSAALNPRYGEFFDHVSYSALGLFYVTHPARLISMADRGLTAMSQPELTYLGSYPVGVGMPAYAKDHRISVIEILSVLFRVVPLLLVAIQMLALFLAIAVAMRRRLGAASVAFGRAVVVTVVLLWTQFWFVMITQGESELSRQMIVATFASALCLPFIVALILLLRQNFLLVSSADEPPGSRAAARRARRSVRDEIGQPGVHAEEGADGRRGTLGGPPITVRVDGETHRGVRG